MSQLFWRRILKKDIIYTKDNKDPFLILNNDIITSFIKLIESDYKFDIKSFIIAKSIQGNEKYTGYNVNFDVFSFMNLHLNIPYESIIIIKDEYTLLIERNHLLNPAFNEFASLSVFLNQVFKFTLYRNNEKIIESDYIANIDKGNYYFIQDRLFLLRCNHKKTNVELNIKKEDENCIIKIIDTHENKTLHEIPFVIKKSTLTENIVKPDVTISHENAISKSFSIDNGGIIIHNITYYNNSIPFNILNNLTYLTQKNTNNIIMDIYFEIGKIHKSFFVKFKELSSFETPITQKDKIIFNPIQLEENDKSITKGNRIPIKWELIFNVTKYTLKLKEEKYITHNNINLLPIQILTYDIIDDNNISTNNECKMIIYNNFDKKELINEKINIIFKPLERPSIEVFYQEMYPIRSVIPTIFAISIIIIVIILTIMYLVFIFNFH